MVLELLFYIFNFKTLMQLYLFRCFIHLKILEKWNTLKYKMYLNILNCDEAHGDFFFNMASSQFKKLN